MFVHTFHIPVMGLAFTIDSPIKVARYGVSSVISIVEDMLIEKMRSHYYQHIQEEYYPISTDVEDYRAKRITDYLNLVDKIVCRQVEQLRNSPFVPGSEIVKYFEMLPDESPLQHQYKQMMQMEDKQEKVQLEDSLRKQIRAGSIDVNIMTKVDKDNYNSAGSAIADGSDALAALRGYACSNLTNSSVILSAGMNPRLYNYLGKRQEFGAKSWGVFDKKVVVKVSDYRSAMIQGKYLAKKGIWTSEFRIESGLNCGGHAFATDGYLMGPILEEFNTKRDELLGTIFEIYQQAIKANGTPHFDIPHPLIITAQGGIGTVEEDRFLRNYYGLASTGWGTPFLLVPEATTVDDATLELLKKATEADIILSRNSPLGVRFQYLKGTSAEKEKFARIQKGKPGSPCTEKLLVSNTEFTQEPICTASHKYQQLKIAQLQSFNLPKDEYQKQLQPVLDKECLCLGLSNAAIKHYNLPPIKKLESVNICPGPNITHFSKVLSLQEMIDHIYGRATVLEGTERPHMFINELNLYVDYLQEQIETESNGDAKHTQYCRNFYENLLSGIAYYRKLLKTVLSGSTQSKNTFLHGLNRAEERVYDNIANIRFANVNTDSSIATL